MSPTGCKALFGSAAAIGAFGLLIAPAPAHAAPNCEVYGFAGPVTIKGNGAITELSFSANGSSAGGTATALGDKGGTTKGTIAGGIIENGPGLLLTYIPDASVDIYTYNGSIRERDLIATGTQGGGTWSTVGPLACLQEKAPAPPDQNDGTAEVTGNVDMYDAPGGTGNKYPGFLAGGKGQRVPLITCNDDNWCNVIAPDGQAVWVWGGFIEH